MRAAILVWLGLLLSHSSASAEDFTGFYAGVNAGWAFERGRDPNQAGPTAAAREAGELPPSVSRIEERHLPDRTASGRTR